MSTVTSGFPGPRADSTLATFIGYECDTRILYRYCIYSRLQGLEDLAKVPFQVQATSVQAAPPLALSLTSCAQHRCWLPSLLSAGPPYWRVIPFPL